ncbi:MAG TPA: hypothetical protein DEA43_03335 [Candidatus Moranbacteria bacterium]|nr:hypothetical protein [Candidatus Moranbacteria bacterium]HBT45888.1 hypothetical protein [Candidatus Moranbacteria bacterium]
MSKEYLDIVDEKGNLTGEKELRSVCHEKGLWHRTVHIYCYRFANNELEFIVHLRAKNKQQNPDKWTTRFGGHVESGHTLEETVTKELFEEAGIKAESKNMISGIRRIFDGFADYSDPQKNREITQAYYYNYDKPVETLEFNDGEVQEAKWMSVKEIKKEISTKDNWVPTIHGVESIVNDLLSKITR